MPNLRGETQQLDFFQQALDFVAQLTLTVTAGEARLKYLSELQQIESILNETRSFGQYHELGRVQGRNYDFPIYKLTFGNSDPKAPVLGLIGGVHGLERIGTQVVLSLLSSFSKLLVWDQSLHQQLKRMRVFFIPIVNPYGIAYMRRSNARGVDLMRNAPIEGEGDIPFLLGGQRISKHLPWYRGSSFEMELEAKALCQAVGEEIHQSEAAITVDFHSGFGLRDRIWFPYARTTKPFEDLSYVHSFFDLMETTYPHHFYQIEPQSLNYTTHGDLWDFLFQQHRSASSKVYLPLCVEMGSWNWVRKNPMQIFSSSGPFNPVKTHRIKRTLRRHNTFFDFLMRAMASPSSWANLSDEQQHKHRQLALARWYSLYG